MGDLEDLNNLGQIVKICKDYQTELGITNPQLQKLASIYLSRIKAFFRRMGDS